MGKRQLTLYVDDNLIQIAKGMGINLSQLFNDTLRIAIDIPEALEEANTSDLEESIEKIRTELGIKKQELGALMIKKKKIQEAKEKHEKKDIVRSYEA